MKIKKGYYTFVEKENCLTLKKRQNLYFFNRNTNKVVVRGWL